MTGRRMCGRCFQVCQRRLVRRRVEGGLEDGERCEGAEKISDAGSPFTRPSLIRLRSLFLKLQQDQPG